MRPLRAARKGYRARLSGAPVPAARHACRAMRLLSSLPAAQHVSVRCTARLHSVSRLNMLPRDLSASQHNATHQRLPRNAPALAEQPARRATRQRPLYGTLAPGKRSRNAPVPPTRTRRASCPRTPHERPGRSVPTACPSICPLPAKFTCNFREMAYNRYNVMNGKVARGGLKRTGGWCKPGSWGAISGRERAARSRTGAPDRAHTRAV